MISVSLLLMLSLLCLPMSGYNDVQAALDLFPVSSRLRLKINSMSMVTPRYSTLLVRGISLPPIWLLHVGWSLHFFPLTRNAWFISPLIAILYFTNHLYMTSACVCSLLRACYTDQDCVASAVSSAYCASIVLSCLGMSAV